ncbi:hypothetical protein BH11BAC3_BH11BAC3_26160 [soil metagenome]
MLKTLFILFFAVFITSVLSAQTKLYPVIKDYGGVWDVPFATEKPDPKLNYKIVAQIGEKIEKKNELSEELDMVARIYNLHVYGGVAQNKLHLTLVIYGGACAVALTNDEYKTRFSTDNPNLKLIDEMKAAGIDIIVCAQSIMKLKIDPATINPAIKIATSRITAVTTLQAKGYKLFTF